jgi:hypothetical protein
MKAVLWIERGGGEAGRIFGLAHKPSRLLVSLFILFSSHVALADDAGVSESSVSGCVENVPNGATKPKITERFPERGFSGYAATLEVTVEHGKGESVLPRGLDLQSAGDAAKGLRSAGFVIPDQDGGAGARLTPLPADPNKPDVARTMLELPLLALPPEPGRHTLLLPPLPVAVARANGELATVCTQPHSITIDDPTASVPDAQPKDNPPPRAQREEWSLLKNAVIWGVLGVVAGAFLAYAIYKWIKRPRPSPPPPPPRPPWEIALEKLDEVRHAGLLETGRFSEYFDRVNDAVRSYLGARYGFDGLESTTDEIMAAMDKVPHFGLALPEIKLFLQECDLVKFANMTPETESCTKALDSGERIVRATMPRERAFDADAPPPPQSPAPPQAPVQEGPRP